MLVPYNIKGDTFNALIDAKLKMKTSFLLKNSLTLFPGQILILTRNHRKVFDVYGLEITKSRNFDDWVAITNIQKS